MGGSKTKTSSGGFSTQLGCLGKWAVSEAREGAFLQLRDLILTVESSSWPVLRAGGSCQIEARPGPRLVDRAASVSRFPLSASSAQPSGLVAKSPNNVELYAHRREENCGARMLQPPYAQLPQLPQDSDLETKPEAGRPGEDKEPLGMKGGSNAGLVS